MATARKNNAERIRELESALNYLKDEFEEIMYGEFATYANPEPWRTCKAWNRAYEVLHAEDVTENP